MKRLLKALAILGVVLLSGCSDEGSAPVVDNTAPDVKILYPIDVTPEVWVVSDSIDVYVAAIDHNSDGEPVQVREVSYWFRHPASVESRFIGTVDQPFDTSRVEDPEIRLIIRDNLPPGWNVYTRRWYTGPTYPEEQGGTPINSGTYVQLFVTAEDQADNEGVSDQIRIQVFNLGEDLRGPRPEFTVTPSNGTLETVFEFDPSASVDDLSPISEIETRWDFDRDGIWDVDWDDAQHADDTQTWQYRTPRIYEPTLEVRNTYLPDSLNRRTRSLQVTPIGGEPEPPHNDYIQIDPINFVMGDTTFVVDGMELPSDRNESPIHGVRLRLKYFIERTEVTNQLYLDYLNLALDEDEPTIEFLQDRVVSTEDGSTFFELSNSRIFYDLDDEVFRIQSGFSDHPVTGVSWLGANAYAIKYGLRLPTEAEWEAAARGTNADLSYPYDGGEEFVTSTARYRMNYRDNGDPFETGTTPVGFFDGRLVDGFQTIDSPSPMGLYDMSGNVSEWTNDWHGDYPSGDVIDPQGPLNGTYKVVRGGSYISSRADVRLTRRSGAAPPDATFPTIGFRTVYNEF